MASERGYLYRRGRYWWVQLFDHDGQRLRFSTGETDRAKADRVLVRKLDELERGPVIVLPKKLTLKQLLDDFEDDLRAEGKDVSRPRTARVHLENFFGSSKKVLAITSALLKRYRTYRIEEEEAASATVKAELAVLHRALAIKVKEGVLDRVVAFPELEPSESRSVWIPEGDHRAIIAKLVDPVAHLCEFLFWTGWRVGVRGSEGALKLTWDKVDWTRGCFLTGAGSRTKKPGRFYFEECLPVADVLRVMRRRHPERVFAHPDGRPLGYKFSLNAFKEAQQSAGLEGYHLHDYRRSVARRLELDPRVTREAAMKITGHRTEHVFRQYAVGEDEDVRAAIRALTDGHILSHIGGNGR